MRKSLPLLIFVFILWLSLGDNLSLNDALATALCMARCSNEQCRQRCNATTVAAELPQIPILQKATAANISLRCRYADRLVLKHNAGIYVIERRKDPQVAWSDPVISNDMFCDFSSLSAQSRYQFRSRRITAKGVHLSETTEWYETYKENYIPKAARNVTISNFEISKSKPGRMLALLKIEPANDRNCLYDVVHWTGRHDLHQYHVNAIRYYGLKLEYIDYNSTNVVYVISKNHAGVQRSENITLTFRTPSCLDIHHDLNICAPPPVTGLRAFIARTARNSIDFRIAWDEPILRPDNYTVIVEPLDGDASVLEIIVAGNRSSVNLTKVVASRRYRIGVMAESAGGSSFQWTLIAKTVDQPIGFEIVVAITTASSLVVFLTIACIYRRCGSEINVAKAMRKYNAFEALKGTTFVVDEIVAPIKSSLMPLLPPVRSDLNERFEIPPDRLAIDKVELGSGIGGLVKLATLRDDNDRLVNVAVKMLREDASENDLKSFQREIVLMKSIGSHKNVVSLIGCCTMIDAPLLVVEYCDGGDLQTYLRTILEDTVMDIYKRKRCSSGLDATGFSRQESDSSTACTINNYLYDFQQEAINEHKSMPQDLLNMACQIANGMEFLSLNRIVHRDLAARNVLVCADKTVKISDFGLSRDIYQENVYKKQSNDRLPLKWMAIEALTHQVYTTYSDVWSFGILLYEIVTLGGNPYPEWHGNEIIQLLKSGYRMQRPSNCSFQLYKIMRSCWHENPLNRPTFSLLKQKLETLLFNTNKNEYLNLSEALK